MVSKPRDCESSLFQRLLPKHRHGRVQPDISVLDGCEWFVRQVAAVFNISTAKLKLAVDTARANTESMMADDLEAIEGDLTRIIELENSVFIDRYRYLGEINLTFSDPIMHRRDERQQAAIARQ